MDPNTLDEEAIFKVACQITESEAREAYLQQICSDDLPLLARVSRLLQVYTQQPSFLENVRTNVVGTLNLSATPNRIGSTIGPYKIREKLGEGGMGIVYAAEQEEPVRRKVALKIIKPGMDTREVIARFEAERQALAMMDHQNIARVLDVGATDSGLPYFVMELVRGVSVTEYCDEQRLSFRERLELFAQICTAVQHAHHKGIIHRDIKPSNVMITLHDGVPVPKVIDFGVAKAINQRLIEGTVYTKVTQVLGTPAYMSPEQAELSGLDIDTRSDIYSLGVLLYELLTGSTPFTKDELSKASFDEMRRVIREADPQRPSERISTLKAEAISTVATQRSNDPRKLSNSLRGELDWIVMKALEKDRTRRYESASAFAADVNRYLADETVEACPPSMNYRLQKYVKRNKAFLVTTATVMLALAAGTGVASWQAMVASHDREQAQQSLKLAEESEAKAKRSEQQATQSEARAEREAAIAKAVTDFLQIELLGNASSGETPDPDVKLRTILDRAATGVDNNFTDQPVVEAAVRDTIGQAYKALGNFAQAEIHQIRAVDLTQRELGSEDVVTLKYSNHLGSLLGKLGRYEEAEKMLRKTLESQSRVLGNENIDAVATMSELGIVLQAQGKNDDAEKLGRLALGIQRRALGQEHPNTLTTMNLIATCCLNQAKYEEAVKLYLKTLELNKRTFGVEHRRTASVMNNLAAVYIGQSNYEKAEDMLLRSLEIRKRILGEEHPETLSSMSNLASVYEETQRFGQSEELNLQVLEIQNRTLGEAHPLTLGTMNNLANVYNNQERYKESEKLHLQALEIQKRTLGNEHPSTLGSMNNLASLYRKQGDYDKAEEVDLQTLEIRKRNLPENHPHILMNMAGLAHDFHSQKRYGKSVALLEETLSLATKTLGPTHRLTLIFKKNLAAIYANWSWHLSRVSDPKERDPPRILELARTAIELFGQPGLPGKLGAALYRNGKYQEAVANLEQTLQVDRDSVDDHWPFLAMGCWKLGDKEKALQYYRQYVTWFLTETQSDLNHGVLAEMETLLGIAKEDRQKHIDEFNRKNATPKSDQNQPSK